jgi:hypothetical protein
MEPTCPEQKHRASNIAPDSSSATNNGASRSTRLTSLTLLHTPPLRHANAVHPRVQAEETGYRVATLARRHREVHVTTCSPSIAAWVGGLALFHIVHRNLGPGGSPPLIVGYVGQCKSIDGRCYADGRACRGQVKHQAFLKHVNTHFQNSKLAPGKTVCGQVCKAWLTSLSQHSIMHKRISF